MAAVGEATNGKDEARLQARRRWMNGWRLEVEMEMNWRLGRDGRQRRQVAVDAIPPATAVARLDAHRVIAKRGNILLLP